MSIYRVNTGRGVTARFHVKKNDEVVILSGTQRGKRGKVLQVLRDRSRVIVEGVNFIKKASRKSPDQPQGGIVEREGTLHISKVMLAERYDARRNAAPKTAAATPAAETEPAAKKSAKGKK